MPIFNNLPTKKGSANVEEISAVKLCLPFTSDLNDKSVFGVPVTNTGITLGSEGAVYAGTDNNLRTNISLSNVAFTIEVIIKAGVPANTQYIINGGVDGSFAITLAVDKKIVIAKSNQTIIRSIEFTDYIGKSTHIAIVNDGVNVKIYFNKELKETIPSNTWTTFLSILEFGRATGGYKYNFVNSGIKYTNKALEPSQFSMTRPFKPVLPNFKVGEKTYIYDNGLWNPDYPYTKNNNVVEGSDSIQVNQNGLLSISNLSINNSLIFFKFTAYGVSDIVIFDGVNYSSATKETHILSTKSIAYNVENYGGININNSIMSIGASGSGNFRVCEIWIED